MASNDVQLIREKKKILIIHHSGYIGGAGVSLLHILKALEQQSFDITVYCPDKPNQMINEINKLGFKCISNSVSIPIFEHYSGCDRSIFNYRTIKNLINIAKRKEEIRKMIENISPDIVAVNSMTLCYIGKLAKSLGVKSVCFHRETYTKGMFGIRTRYIKRSLSNDFDKVIFISNYDLKQSGSMTSCTHVIYDKVILENFVNRKTVCSLERDDVKKVLYTGGMAKLKGAHVIINAMARCKDNIHLIFLQYSGLKQKRKLSDCIGIKEKLKFLLRKDYTARVLSLIDKYNMWDRVHFYPATNDVSKYFISCDFVVFPSTYPHQARPIYEAGAVKKPIIISESQNISEFVKNGENGFVFKNCNSIILAKLINKLADDNELLKTMGNNNYSRTIRNHDFLSLREELIKVFNCLEKKS